MLLESHSLPWGRLLVLALCLAGLGACGRTEERGEAAGPELATTDPCRIALAAHQPEKPAGMRRERQAIGLVGGEEIVRLQREARTQADPLPALERLGWRFVAEARVSYDPGYYKLAEQAALCMEAKRPRAPAALLLRGHVLHNLHRFKEMELLARDLVAARGTAFDHGLLGDALLELGRIDEAVTAYQRMMDLKPGLQAYSRAAHVRWLKGDLPGALDLMRRAVRAGSARDPESVAWAQSRLAFFELQGGAADRALAASDAALELVPDYAPALLLRGQILLVRGLAPAAVAILERAAGLNPLPEYEWALADALRAAGRSTEAQQVEARLLARGAVEDPRTFSLYLATRGEQVETALRLAMQELAVRGDVFTLDALAWSQAAAGKANEARVSMDRALALGTRDARLFYHAGVIAARAGREAEAERWLVKAARVEQTLLPSEREDLHENLARLERPSSGD